MSSPEDLFQHLSPSDRPDTAEIPVRTPETHLLVGMATKALLLFPEVHPDGTPTSYSDFDRSSYIIAKAAELDIPLEHTEVSYYLRLADKEMIARKTNEEDVKEQDSNWKRYGTASPHLLNTMSAEDIKDMVKLEHTEITPQQILEAGDKS